MGNAASQEGPRTPEVRADDDTKQDLGEFASIRFLEPKDAIFSTTSGGTLALQLGDESFTKVDLHRAFPFTLADEYISVRNEKGDEIGMLEKVDVFDEESKKALRHELDWRYYTPRILEILHIKDEFGYMYWDVETDRGFRKFVTRGRDDGVHSLSDTRLLVVDMTGNRFEVSDLTELDAKSLRYLEALI